jgi:NAD(P)-dependent dehydrogenase (short-subunit alcohol dehydrogenase family)
MTRDQASKVWFITGASSGFGRALADELLARGERVVATARNSNAMNELAARGALTLRLDVTNTSEVSAAIAHAVDRFGDIDVLVNNAGYSIVGALEETSELELRCALETMFFGPVALMREVLSRMRARQSGTIVQITSMGGVTTAAGFGAYCAAKHALEGLSECLAKELAPFGVRVLIVEPGAFRTALFGSAFRTMPPIDAYAPSVGPTRAYAAQADGAQAGDPRLAARAIADAVAAGSPHLRLPLGADAVAGIRAKLDALRADVDATEAVARSTALASR